MQCIPLNIQCIITTKFRSTGIFKLFLSLFFYEEVRGLDSNLLNKIIIVYASNIFLLRLKKLTFRNLGNEQILVETHYVIKLVSEIEDDP